MPSHLSGAKEKEMNIEVISLDEDTGKIVIEFDDEAKLALISVGFNTILKALVSLDTEVHDD
jgi:hypothetical protein